MFKNFGFLLLLLLPLCTRLSFAQNSDLKKIENTFLEYINTIEQGNLVQSLEYINSDFFQHVSKERFLKSLQLVAESKKIKFRFSNTKINKIAPLRKVDNQFYTVLSYTSLVSLEFFPIKPMRTREQELNIIKKSFKNNMLQTDISFNKETNSYQFLENKKVCVSSYDNKNSWKFLIVDTNKKNFLSKILPKEIINQL